MPAIAAQAGASRVLAFFPHSRITGRVAFDGFGLVPRSFTAFELRRARSGRAARLRAIVVRSVRRFRPAVIAIGSSPQHRDLVRHVARAAQELGIRTVTVPLATASRSLLSEPPVGFDKLAQVVAAFLPELRDHVRPESTGDARETRRRLSPAWRACAAGLAVLVDERPRVAAALLRKPIPVLEAVIAARELALHPTPDL